jgi:hypothetical protein
MEPATYTVKCDGASIDKRRREITALLKQGNIPVDAISIAALIQVTTGVAIPNGVTADALLNAFAVSIQDVQASLLRSGGAPK